MIKRICVFCGSNPGKDPVYVKATKELGKLMAKNKIGLVYGGASVGLMGTIANTVAKAGGEAIGVIPKLLAHKEIAHPGLTELHIVSTMHERKFLMSEYSHAFVALPGGLGTLEELFEVLTWAQLGIHGKPIGILNINGYFNKLINFLNHAIKHGFVGKDHSKLWIVAKTPAQLIKKLLAYKAPELTKWIDKEDI